MHVRCALRVCVRAPHVLLIAYGAAAVIVEASAERLDLPPGDAG
ncbi:hypothetical protein QIS99_21510 [Streptomyces sp. B-S-A8]|uniref:Uncharacterized protein n=1 Tax=Streptomyces solicavernae TaxID=3043614 RepID=A0ABT6RX58_9ACTN|nr:hypothetical protein [Streptomyces sp. B-S-A8]MDI3388749.1 hypothetical protein [Streptomyces sp. B-S-A8]